MNDGNMNSRPHETPCSIHLANGMPPGENKTCETFRSDALFFHLSGFVIVWFVWNTCSKIFLVDNPISKVLFGNTGIFEG
ncbi:hypothetical protein CEXT_743881 [Caerostris extrusa]|uniref:Uncharacterized protein n=1 Tax=Caerostris extrusa TaxID=172846 RepID=A0AAV4NAG7_CAEEX|nr:hypothetical protein CEXT_743881 [Caerostris extrusa]